MYIQYNDSERLFTLNTMDTTYQMKVDESGYLRHLFYGKKTDDTDFSYLHREYDRGFSGNPHHLGAERTFSLDTVPLEYSSANVGDYRISSLSVTGSDGSFGADLRYAGHEIVKGKYAIPGLPAAYAEEEDEAETLVIDIDDKVKNITVRLKYGVFPEKNVITRAAEIINRGEEAIHLGKAYSCCLDIPFFDPDIIHFHGRHCMERQPERTRLNNCVQTISSVRGTSSHQHNPFVILCDHEATEDKGDCYGMMLVYSGSFRIEAEREQFGCVRLTGGISDEQFSWRLDKGESFHTPEMLITFSPEGLGTLSRQYHHMITDNICRGEYKKALRPVLFNNWEATYFDFDEDKILSLADEAAGLGAELFVLDDGWFRGRDSDIAGLGDWYEHETKLPHGLKHLSEAVVEKGMRFGLWVEPECVNEDSELYRAHPDWALKVPGREPVLGRMQLMLDLSRKEVREYLYESMVKVLESADISYIKWDMNRSICDVYSAALPPERQGEVRHRYVLGLYELMERLTGKYPHILFEGCSGGGGRFDAGLLHYMPQIWCSDDTDAIGRLRIQDGTSYGYPASTMGCHVSASPNHQTGRSTPLKTRGVVAMSGAFGYELDLFRLTDEEKEEIREQIVRYREYEELILYGEYHRIASGDDNGIYSAWEYVSADGKNALLSVVVTGVEANPRLINIRLKGLIPDKAYRVTCGEEELTLTGAALMYGGYTLIAPFGDYPACQLTATAL